MHAARLPSRTTQAIGRAIILADRSSPRPSPMNLRASFERAKEAVRSRSTSRSSTSSRNKTTTLKDKGYIEFKVRAVADM